MKTTLFKTIVWATYGSDFAGRALPFAVDLARQDGAELVVVHVDQRMLGRTAGLPILGDEEDLRAELRSQVEELRRDGISARLEIVTTTTKGVGDAVAEAADELKADVIVVGTHGRGPIGLALLGSVARQLMHAATCPVLAVPVKQLAGDTEHDPVATSSLV